MFMWCLGETYEKRFLWGVDGVKLAAGRALGEALDGGVLDLVGSCIVVEYTECRCVGSGD